VLVALDMTEMGGAGGYRPTPTLSWLVSMIVLAGSSRFEFDPLEERLTPRDFKALRQVRYLTGP
jgi:hypothetical protein